MEMRLARPNAAQVQALWSKFLKLWERATEEERCQLLPLLVERVEMTEKERGFCDLAFQAQNPRSLTNSFDGNVLVNSVQGAGRLIVPNSPGRSSSTSGTSTCRARPGRNRRSLLWTRAI